jgi:hypothetical protein
MRKIICSPYRFVICCSTFLEVFTGVLYFFFRLFDVVFYSESETRLVYISSFLYSENPVYASLGVLHSSFKQQVLAAGKRREPLWIHWGEKEGSAGAEEVNPPVPRLSHQVLQGQRYLKNSSLLDFTYAMCFASMLFLIAQPEWSPFLLWRRNVE